MKPFFSFQKPGEISGNCIKFRKERIKTSVAIEMFKTENHCKTPQVVDATDGTRHTRKRGLRTLKRALSLAYSEPCQRFTIVRVIQKSL